MADVDGKTIKVKAGGITVEVDPRRFADVRVQLDMGKLARFDGKKDKGGDASMEAMRTYAHMLEVMFGGSAEDVMERLAEKHDGILTDGVWGDFFKELLESASAKNS